jgi:tetratricopeptide (TPR) repeat protein
MKARNFMMFRQLCVAVLVFIAGSGAASAQEKNPECVRQGKDLFAEKKFKEAVRVLEKCGNDPSAWGPLGLAYFELSYMDDAKSYLKKAIGKDPENLKLKSAYADAFAYNREFKKAVEEFRSLLKVHPTDRTLRKGLAQALGWNKQYVEAITLYRELIKEDPQDYESWIQIGVLISWDKKFKEAVAEFRAIIDSKPSRKWETEAHIRMAEVISWQKKFGEAIAEYESVKKVDPVAIDAYLGAGQVLEWQGKYKEARKEYEKALQIDPQNKKAKGYLQQLMWVK